MELNSHKIKYLIENKWDNKQYDEKFNLIDVLVVGTVKFQNDSLSLFI